ncbi:MAG TPA: hypothetical protein VIK59_08210 [Verrucomicrobiae bacterium]
MIALCRYEILLPLRFNDGQPVPPELVAETVRKLREHFGAVSWESQPIQGQWQHEGIVYRDDLVRVFVDVADTPENRQFFRQFKEQVKTDFQQLDIWLTSYPIDVL